MRYLKMQILTRITIPILYYINLILKGQPIAAAYSFLVSFFLKGIILALAWSLGDTLIQAGIFLALLEAFRLIVRVAFCHYRKVLPTASIWSRAERIPAGSGTFAYAAKAAEIMDDRIQLFVRKGYL